MKDVLGKAKDLALTAKEEAQVVEAWASKAMEKEVEAFKSGEK